MDGAIAVDGTHGEGVDDGFFGGSEALLETILAIFVHQEADRAAVHAVDRFAGLHELVQGREHEAVAAKRDDHVSVPRRNVAITPCQRVPGCFGFRRRAGDEGDAVAAKTHGLACPTLPCIGTAYGGRRVAIT